MDHHTTRVSVEAIIPTRGLIGFESDLVNLTRGEGIMSHLFREYAPFKGEMEGRNRGVMVSMEAGTSKAYSLNNIQARGKLFIGPQEEIYAGMIIGENARPEDLPVNPCKAKNLTNMRSQGDGKGIQLEAPLKMTLERAIEYIGSDEYVEVTPKSLRLRKRILDANARSGGNASRGARAAKIPARLTVAQRSPRQRFSPRPSSSDSSREPSCLTISLTESSSWPGTASGPK